MKKPLYMAALSLAATLMLAPAALAQEAGPGGEGPCTGTPFEQYIPEVNGCVTTEGQPFPGEVTVFDADTREPIGTLEEVTASIEGGNGGTGAQYPDTTGGQYAAPEPTTPTPTTTAAPTPTTPTTAAPLPATGGPALLLPAAGLLATGLLALTTVRRRP